MTKYYTISEAAKLLEIHVETLRRWDKSGKLKAIRMGKKGQRRYLKDVIQKVKEKGINEKEENNFPSSIFADRLIDFHSSAVPDFSYFTRLVCAIAQKVEGLVDCEIIDGPYDKKRDILGYEIKKYNKRSLVYIQCKRDKDIDEKDLKQELDEMFKNIQDKKIQMPAKIIFAISIDLNATIRDNVKHYAKTLFPTIESIVFWCAKDLDIKIKSCKEILQQYILTGKELTQYHSSNVPELSINNSYINSVYIASTENTSNEDLIHSKNKSLEKKIQYSSNLIQNGQIEKAKELLLTILGETKNSNHLSSLEAKIYNNLGLCYKDSKEKDFQKSIDYFEKSIESDPKYIKPQCNLANTLIIRNTPGDIEHAWEIIRPLWKREGPKDPLVLMTYLWVYDSKTNEKKALKKGEEIEKRYKKNKIKSLYSPAFRHFMAVHYFNLKDYNKADRYIEKNIQNDEFDIDAKYLKALIIINQAEQFFTNSNEDFLPQFKKPNNIFDAEKLLKETFLLAKNQGRVDLLPEIHHNWDLCRLWIWKKTGKRIARLEYSPPIELADKTLVNRMQEFFMENKKESAFNELRPHIERLKFKELIDVSDKFFWNGSPEISLQLLEIAGERFPDKVSPDYWLIKSLRQVLLEDKFGAIQSVNRAKDLAIDENNDLKLQATLSHRGAVFFRYEREGDRILENMLEYDQHFPENKAVQKFDFNNEKDREFIINSFSERARWFDNILNVYKNNPIPVYSLEKAFKRPFIEIWEGRGVNFPWEYNQPSSIVEEELKEKVSISKGLIFDYLSLLTLTKANLLGYMPELNKKLYIHYQTFRKIQEELIQYESPTLRKLWNYLRNTQQIIFTHSSSQLDTNLKKLDGILDDWMLQSIAFAKENRLTIVSDDLRLLMVLNDAKIGTTNSFALLKIIRQKNLLDNKSYSQALGNIAECIYSFLPFNADDLHEIIWQDDYQLTKKSLHLIHQMFLPNIDINSFMSVYISFISKLWNTHALPKDKIYWITLITNELSLLISKWNERQESYDDTKRKFIEQFAFMWRAAIELSNLEELSEIEEKINEIFKSEVFEKIKPIILKHINLKRTNLRE